jgi:hypothetical protein
MEERFHSAGRAKHFSNRFSPGPRSGGLQNGETEKLNSPMENQRWPVWARALLGRPVLLGAVQVGTVSDVIANTSLGHLLGFEVRGRDAYARFLPWVGAEIEPDHIAVRSVFSLLSSCELPLYLDYGVRLSERLVHEEPNGSAPAREPGRHTLRDLIVDRHGDVSAVVFADGSRRRRARLEAVPAGDASSTRPAA